MKKYLLAALILNGILSCMLAGHSSTVGTGTSGNAGITLIPYPRSIALTGENCKLNNGIRISTDEGASPEAMFAATELSFQLREQWGLTCSLSKNQKNAGIVLTCANVPSLPNEGYIIETTGKQVIIRANNATGLFYGVQTLLQLIRKTDNIVYAEGVVIRDWPDIPIRAVHYDTKHFQEKKEYVFAFIRTLATYKINMLVWEWEDKFAYRSHPEIAAPGAFSMAEMQEFTRYARKYHIQLVPLIQGLGHVSYILKHPENKHLREIPSNNWGFCPLKEGTYKLMADLINEAIEATPGSDYLHIGCDETYVLGEGIACGCSEMAEKEGKFALMETYVNKVASIVKNHNRKPMAWDGGYNPAEKMKPVKDLFTPGGFNNKLDEAALANGYPLYIYDPNPGIEHLFLPYFYRENASGKPVRPHLEESYAVLTKAVLSGKFTGMITTSWNCSGVHNQIWMLRYITAAAYSWNGKESSPEDLIRRFFLNYYGPRGRDIKEIYELLNKASYFYMNAFERKVWHWGEVGKTHLPDLPRDDMEFDPYWNTAYAGMIANSVKIIPEMERVLTLCEENVKAGVSNVYDFELFNGLAKLFRHTARTYLALSELEKSIEKAAGSHFDDSRATYNELTHAVSIIENNIAERNQVFAEIKTTWEKSQLPKGLSTPEKAYVHARDEQRNFANRRPDLSFMVCDEEALGLEEYLGSLLKYISAYKVKYVDTLP